MLNPVLQLLKDANADRDTKKKRDVVKKVIAYMTLGIDVSRLFTDMIMVQLSVDRTQFFPFAKSDRFE
jgi:vesicle coat complex subunit